MSALPVYQVEFIPLERRLDDRRIASQGSGLLRRVTADRREVSGRRGDDRLVAALKIV